METISTSHLPFKVTVNPSTLKLKLDTNLMHLGNGLRIAQKIMTILIGSPLIPLIKAKRSGLKLNLGPANSSRLWSGFMIQTCFIIRLGILRIRCYRLGSNTKKNKVQKNGISKTQFRTPLATTSVCSPKSVRMAKNPAKVSQAQHLQLASFLWRFLATASSLDLEPKRLPIISRLSDPIQLFSHL